MKSFIYFLLFSFLFCSLNLQAVDIDKKCFLEIERNFFKIDSVLLIYSYYQKHTSQAQWKLAAAKLRARNGSIPRMMKERAKKIRPNPLGRPFRPDEAVRLLKEVTREVFIEVMQDTQAAEPRSWNEAFNYLFDYEMGKCSVVISP